MGANVTLCSSSPKKPVIKADKGTIENFTFDHRLSDKEIEFKNEIIAYKFYKKTAQFNFPLITDLNWNIISQIANLKENVSKWSLIICENEKPKGITKTTTSDSAIKPNMDNNFEGFRKNEPFVSKVFTYLQNAYKYDNAAYVNYLSKGPPNRLRWIIWMVVALNHSNTITEEEYKKLLTQNLEDEIEKQIKKDIPRSSTESKYFETVEGYNALYNILKAMALTDTELSYCQGMNIICARLLLISDGNEIETFVMMKYLFSSENGFKLRELYLNGFPRARLFMYLIKEIIKIKIPKVFNKIEEICLPDDCWLFKWFQSLFNLPFTLQINVRLLDCLMAFGCEFMLKFALGTIKYFEAELLKTNELDEFLLCFDYKFTSIKGLIEFRESLINHAMSFKLEPNIINSLISSYEATIHNESSVNDSIDSYDYLPEKHEIQGFTKRLTQMNIFFESKPSKEDIEDTTIKQQSNEKTRSSLKHIATSNSIDNANSIEKLENICKNMEETNRSGYSVYWKEKSWLKWARKRNSYFSHETKHFPVLKSISPQRKTMPTLNLRIITEPITHPSALEAISERPESSRK